MAEQIDPETRYELPATAALNPTELADVLRAARAETGSHEQEDVHWDTAGFALLRHRVTLRHREGGTDDGWLLALPESSAEPRELHAPTGDGPPPELTDVVAGLAGGQPLRRVAVLRTRRVTHRLLDTSGRLVAEVADDTVHAATTDGPAASALAWREVSMELGPAAGGGTRKRADRALRTAGALRSTGPSTFARAVGLRPPAPDPARAPLAAYVRAQVDALAGGDLDLRRDLVGVHDARVAVHRLRSTLHTLRPVPPVQTATPAGLNEELRWYGRLLGAVRDPEVMLSHLLTQLDALPPELVLGRVRAELVEQLQTERTRRARELATAMRSPRYAALLAAVSQLAADIEQAPQPTAGTLRRRAARAARRADVLLAEARSDSELHRARRAVRRARSAAELARPAGGSGRQVKELRRRQDLLGEHQDAVGAAELLRALGAAGSAAGSNGFTYGLLHEQERERARRARLELGA